MIRQKNRLDDDLDKEYRNKVDELSVFKIQVTTILKAIRWLLWFSVATATIWKIFK